MLNAYFGGVLDNTIISVDGYFDSIYEYDWFMEEDPVIKQIVKDIDKSELIGMNVISPYLGSISIKELSGGVKTLIMMYKMDNFITDLKVMGNNCEGWILKIADMKDIQVSVTNSIMRFEGYDRLNAKCINDGEDIGNSVDWTNKILKYVVGIDV